MSPTYVLDSHLQDGIKLPKWQLQACRAMFLEFSKLHSSTVGLVMNLNSKRVSPQYHVVYDDEFQTTYAPEEHKPATWDTLFSRRILYTNEPFDLSPEWMPVSEGAKSAPLASQGVTFKLNDDPCLLYTSPSPRDQRGSRMPSSA